MHTTYRPTPRPQQGLAGQLGQFLAESVRCRRSVGAIVPSGPRLAETLATAVRRRPNSRVLEVGAGTGAVTRTIAKHLGPDGRLDIVESNERFADQIRTSLATDDDLGSIADRSRLFQMPVQDLDISERYDCIISGLPFANFAPKLVDTIMRSYLFELLAPGGQLRYFSYLGTDQIRFAFGERAIAATHRALTDVLDGYQRDYGVGDDVVWPNLPPARVRTLQAPHND